MKMTFPVTSLLVVLVVSVVISADAARLPKDQVQRRGFRHGAGDRFSHGFGKRTNEDATETSDLDGIYPNLVEGTSLLQLGSVAVAGAVERRGFRNGAGDRFSHGFGKRTNEDATEIANFDDIFADTDDERGVATDIVLEHVIRHPEVLRDIIQRNLDENRDGFVSRKEFL